jgi:kumamolisin
MLDIEVAGAVAQGANIVVYFTPNTDQGFQDALSPPFTTSSTALRYLHQLGRPGIDLDPGRHGKHGPDRRRSRLLGVTITVASGDNGSSDGVSDGQNHVDFPASSPHVLACGGTNLVAAGATIQSETVWNDGARAAQLGGGYSTVFPIPSLAIRRRHRTSAACRTSPATPTPKPATTSASTARTWS